MRTLRLRLWPVVLLSAVLGFVACQSYDFVKQPLTDMQGSHLTFTVQTPSKADILFMVDNSGSMAPKQQQLAASITTLLATLAPQDTKYRIGVVSSDAYGFLTDCQGNNNPAVASNFYSTMGSAGSYCGPNQSIPGCAANGNNVANPNNCWQLRRPHDGALGRLIAGYDPNSFNPNNYVTCVNPNNPNNAIDPNNPSDPNNALNANNCKIWEGLVDLMPTGAYAGPTSLYDSQGAGARWVINRDAIDHESCDACGCLAATCAKGNACYETCSKPVADIMVQAYFRANINALGTNGFGWEQGLKSSLWAVGIDPEQQNPNIALDPPYNLVAPTGNPNLDPPNVYGGTDTPANPTYGSWLRDDALLALMYVSDEQDCSMPQAYITNRADFEQYSTPAQPIESMCYQRNVQDQVLSDARYDPNHLTNLFLKLKNNKSSQVAIGVIGSLQLNGPSINPSSAAIGADCMVQNSASPSTACVCLDGNLTFNHAYDSGWCQYTLNALTNTNCSTCTGSECNGCLPSCQGRSGSIYVAFANGFSRKSFESVCRNDTSAYGPAMESFARLATQACFNLNGIAPFNGDPNNITVERTAEGTTNTQILPLQPSISIQDGWYYDGQNNAVCLTGLERLIGDVYDIYIQQNDTISYAQ